MLLHTINTGLFKLDGGAMHGVVPKSIWNKLNPADEYNLCTWAMRCLLIETGKRLILIDTGCGNKQSNIFFKHYHLSGSDTLTSSIQNHGYSLSDVTDVLLTHMHFDHVGGALSYDAHLNIVPTFENAMYWVHPKHWEWALNPNDREAASFLKENFVYLLESGKVKFVSEEIFDGIASIQLHTMYGHTEAMIVPSIHYKGTVISFMADLVPSAAHLPIAYTMAYDVRPLITMEEKKLFLNKALHENHVLMFQHDAVHECCTLHTTDKGIRAKDFFKLSEL